MSLMTAEKLQAIVEAALMVAGHPLQVQALQNLFNEDERPNSDEILAALDGIRERHKESGIELYQVASGYRLQAKTELSPWLAKLWEERPARYSRAFLETLAIIAYKQPITRAEIEEIRGVTVSTNIMKTLTEREWIRLIGFRDTPGKPAIYGTTKTFLDHFSLPSLTALPTLAEFKDMQTHDDELQVQLALENSDIGPDNSEMIPEERDAIISEDMADETEKTDIVATADDIEESDSDEAIDSTEATDHTETEDSDEVEDSNETTAIIATTDNTEEDASEAVIATNSTEITDNNEATPVEPETENATPLEVRELDETELVTS